MCLPTVSGGTGGRYRVRGSVARGGRHVREEKYRQCVRNEVWRRGYRCRIGRLVALCLPPRRASDGRCIGELAFAARCWLAA